ncbi:MAG: DUF302 domain-containing protein [Balneolaceae bacterium]|jgi:uncharacterized protein (DUF302 family)
MSYYFTTTLDSSFDEAIEKTTEVLKEEGFGILTEIDVKETMKKKLDKDMYNYRILGACNPPMAWEALKAENKIGAMLPCNVIVQEREKGKIEVSAIDPVASMTAVNNKNLGEVAREVQGRLKKVIEKLG